MTYLLHVAYATGTVQTLTFSSAFLRGLYLIGLSALPVLSLRIEDRS